MLTSFLKKPIHAADIDQLGQDSEDKKSRLLVTLCFVCIYGSGSLFILSLIANLSNDYSNNQFSEITTTQKTQVERAARKLFSKGSWHYKESKLESNVIHIFIEIPAPLDLSVSQQKNYIRQSVCPKFGNQVWKSVNASQVKLHLINNWIKFKATKQSGIAEFCK